jgi:hypothetical protein
VSLLSVFSLLPISFKLIFILVPSFFDLSSLQVLLQECSWEALSFCRHTLLNVLSVSSKAVNDGKEDCWHLQDKACSDYLNRNQSCSPWNFNVLSFINTHALVYQKLKQYSRWFTFNTCEELCNIKRQMKLSTYIIST